MALAVFLALTVVGCKSAERRAADAMALAQYQASAGDFNNAAVNLRRSLELRDDNADGWTMLGQVEQQRERVGEAFQAYQRADELKPGDVSVLRALCYTGYIVGAARDSEDAADRLLAVSPADPNGLSVKALLALDQRDTATALRYADAILAVTPGDEAAIMLKARSEAVKGDIASALTLVNDAIGKSKNPGGLQVLALQLYRLSGDVEGLRKTYPATLAISSGNSDLSADYANFLFKTGDTKKASKVLFDAMIKEQRTGPYLVWAFQLLETYAPRGAAPLFDPRIYNLPPSLLRTFSARYLLDRGAAADAIRLVAPAKGIDPADLGIYARALLATGRVSEAQKIVDDVLQKSSANDVDALITRSTIARSAGRLDRAVIDAQAAVVSDATSVAARIALVRAFTAQKKDALARDALVDAANDLPHSTVILSALLDFLQEKGDTDAMTGAIRTFADGNIGDPRGWNMLESICAKQHNSACVETARAKGKAALTDFYLPNPNRPNRERGLFSPIKRPK